MSSTILLIGNRGNKNMGDEIILVGMIKYFLCGHPNRQSVQMSKGDFWEMNLEKYYRWEKPFKHFDKIIIPTSDKRFVYNFLRQFFNENFISKKIILVRELPHGIRSFIKWIFKCRFLDIVKYFKANAVAVGGGEIFTEECWSGPSFFTITAIPFLIKYFLYKILGNKLDIYLFGGIQQPYRCLNKILINFWILNADGIFVRDFESIESVAFMLWKRGKMMNNYFENIKKVFFMFDHSFLLFSNKITGKVLFQDSKQDRKNKKGKDILVININPIGYKKFGNEFVKFLERKLDHYREMLYIPVNILEDNEFHFLLKHKFKKIKIKKILRDRNFENFVKNIRDTKGGIVMRLHMFLILCYLNKSIVVFKYQRKIEKMYNVLKVLKNLTKMTFMVILK